MSYRVDLLIAQMKYETTVIVEQIFVCKVLISKYFKNVFKSRYFWLHLQILDQLHLNAFDSMSAIGLVMCFGHKLGA